MKVINIETTLLELVSPITLALRETKLPADLLEHRAKQGDVEGTLRALDLAAGDVESDFARGAINAIKCLVEALEVA